MANLIVKLNMDEIKEYLASDDVVEVVRCKDCKYSVSVPKWYDFELGCSLYREYIKETDFCSKGERKKTDIWK